MDMQDAVQEGSPYGSVQMLPMPIGHNSPSSYLPSYLQGLNRTSQPALYSAPQILSDGRA